MLGARRSHLGGMSAAFRSGLNAVAGSRVAVGLGEHWVPLRLGGIEVSGATLVASSVGGFSTSSNLPLDRESSPGASI
jgi:hypothetical protein